VLHNASVKNLIFDLGGVILDLSTVTTLAAFSSLSGMDQGKVMEIFSTSEEFLLYEKGLITDEEFRVFIRRAYEIEATDEDIDRCWNAMLLALPFPRLNLLNRLKEQYRVFLLSNTNGIHLTYINSRMMPEECAGKELDHYFHSAHYSHRMKMRKPDAEIFTQVLEENQLKPEETLFLDDNAGNIGGAAALGIQTVLVKSPDLMLTYFHA
jgi:glucose-1-phosphatase